MEKSLQDQFPPSGLRGGEVIKVHQLLPSHPLGKTKVTHSSPAALGSWSPVFSVSLHECSPRTAVPNTKALKLFALYSFQSTFKVSLSLAASQWCMQGVWKSPGSQKKLLGIQLADSSHRVRDRDKPEPGMLAVASHRACGGVAHHSGAPGHRLWKDQISYP